MAKEAGPKQAGGKKRTFGKSDEGKGGKRSFSKGGKEGGKPSFKKRDAKGDGKKKFGKGGDSHEDGVSAAPRTGF